MIDATTRWRAETAEMSATDALRRLVERISAQRIRAPRTASTGA